MGWQEPHKVQKGEARSPALGEEQPPATVYAGQQLVGNSFAENDPWRPGGKQLNYQPAT